MCHAAGIQIIIDSAIWGIEDKRADVTDFVRTYVIGGKLDMECGINNLGDPRPGLGKVLTIKYSVDGKSDQKIFREHEIARLP